MFFKGTPHHASTRVDFGKKYSQNLNFFLLASMLLFVVLLCRGHEIWSRFFGTTFKDDLTYVLEDCFDTFPFPSGLQHSSGSSLRAAGQAYHDHRAMLMVEADEGMTRTYNRFHDAAERRPAIQRL